MSLVPSLLQAVIGLDGEALVIHVGEKPYVVAPSGQVELATRALTFEAVTGILEQMLPGESRQALEEFGAIQYELPPLAQFKNEHFTVVAARGGDDVWVEVRRHRSNDDDLVPAEMFETPQPLPAHEPVSTQSTDSGLALPDSAQLWPHRPDLGAVHHAEMVAVHEMAGAMKSSPSGFDLPDSIEIDPPARHAETVEAPKAPRKVTLFPIAPKATPPPQRHVVVSETAVAGPTSTDFQEFAAQGAGQPPPAPQATPPFVPPPAVPSVTSQPIAPATVAPPLSIAVPTPPPSVVHIAPAEAARVTETPVAEVCAAYSLSDQRGSSSAPPAGSAQHPVFEPSEIELPLAEEPVPFEPVAFEPVSFEPAVVERVEPRAELKVEPTIEPEFEPIIEPEVEATVEADVGPPLEAFAPSAEPVSVVPPPPAVRPAAPPITAPRQPITAAAFIPPPPRAPEPEPAPFIPPPPPRTPEPEPAPFVPPPSAPAPLGVASVDSEAELPHAAVVLPMSRVALHAEPGQALSGLDRLLRVAASRGASTLF